MAYSRVAEAERALERAREEERRAQKIWARVSDLSTDDLLFLERLLQEHLHDED